MSEGTTVPQNQCYVSLAFVLCRDVGNAHAHARFFIVDTNFPKRKQYDIGSTLTNIYPCSLHNAQMYWHWHTMQCMSLASMIFFVERTRFLSTVSLTLMPSFCKTLI